MTFLLFHVWRSGERVYLEKSVFRHMIVPQRIFFFPQIFTDNDNICMPPHGMSVMCPCDICSLLHSTRASVGGFECVLWSLHIFNRVDLPKLIYQGSFSVPVYHFYCYIHFTYINPKNKDISMQCTHGSSLYTVRGRNVKKSQLLYTRCQRWEHFSEDRKHSSTRFEQPFVCISLRMNKSEEIEREPLFCR